MQRLRLGLYLFSILISYSAHCENKKLKTIWEDFKSPITTNAKYIALSGTVITSILHFNDHNLNQKARSNTQYNRPLKDMGYVGEALGWGYLNLLYTAGFFAHSYWTNNKKSAERSEMMMNTSLLTLFWTSGLKILIKSRRPGFPEENDSFPSGHTSMSVAFASLVTAEHGLYWGAPSFLVAGFISYSRLNDDYHWVQDIIAGATIGASYAWGVYFNRRKKEVPFIFSFVPSIKGIGGNITFTKNF